MEVLNLKKLGFSDSRLAELTKLSEKEVRNFRNQLGVYPVYKRVDPCSAEFKSVTPYMYSCYEGDGLNVPECEAEPTDKNKVIIYI